MMNHLFPYLYAIAAFLCLIQAMRVMARGLLVKENSCSTGKAIDKYSHGDRTGRITIHPELLNQEGQITNEDLLTVRFSSDTEPPHSTGKSIE